MFARGRSKERSSRKTTPPQASYMDSNQFANYLSELREKRVTRPGGAKTPGASSARTSTDPASSAARTPVNMSTTTLNTTAAPPYPRADSALSNRTTTTTLSHAPTRPSMSTSRSRRSMPPPASPEVGRKSMQIDPTIVQPSATYIERGQRWMEREEAGSLRDALEDMDAAELAAGRLGEEQMEEEKRIQAAAQKEASELVHAHLYPEEVARRQEEEERKRQTGYRYHLRKGSYQHARAASVGREYKGEDAIVVDLSRPGIGSRTFSDESTMRSASRTSMHRDITDSSSRPDLENCQSTDEFRGRAPEKKNGKSYGTLSSTISGVASKSRSWSARRKSGGKRNISGEVNTVFHPDQIWEEPESSRESSKNRAKKDKGAANKREDMYNDVQPLSPLKVKNPANRVQFVNENEVITPSPAGKVDTSLPGQKIDRFEIFRNPPSQSRNPLYTANNPPPPRTPSPDKNLPEVPMKDGKEIRNEELRKATTKSLKDRSEKLPTPTAVSDRVGRPIVSFDKKWMPADEKRAAEEKEKALLDKNKADSCPPVSAARTKLSEPQAGGSASNNGTLSTVEAAKRKIFGSATQEQINAGEGVGERTGRSPERAGIERRSGEGHTERGGGSGKGGEKREEKEREGYFEVAGGQADKEYELGKVGDAGAGKISDTAAGGEVKVTGKWIVETRKGVSTFRVEGEREIKEQQARKDGFPYRLEKSSASSSTTSISTAMKEKFLSAKSSKESTPRASMSQEKDEAVVDTAPIATPLVSIVQKPLPAPPSEPVEEHQETSIVTPIAAAAAPLRPTRHIVSIAPPASAVRPTPIERTSTLMARSPFARPRAESFISRRSIFQPEKSVPACPALVSGSARIIENEKQQPIGQSLLSAARPRPSFLTRTRSRSSVSGHSVFALKTEPVTALAPAASTVDTAKLPDQTEKPTPQAQTIPEEKPEEEARPAIARARSSESSVSKALPSLPPTPSDQAQDSAPLAVSSAATLSPIHAPFGQSLLSAARPRPSFLTRTRSRSSVAGHSVFALKKTGPPAAPALSSSDSTKPVAQSDVPAPPALTSQEEKSTEDARSVYGRTKSSESSVSRALPPPPRTTSEEAPKPAGPIASTQVSTPAKAREPDKPISHITNSHLSTARARPSLLTRTRSRSSVAGNSPYSLKGAEPASPLTESSSPALPAHDEDRPPFVRSKSSETSVTKAATRQSLDGPQAPRFAPRSPFARPSLGPTSLSTPPEMSLNKTDSLASRSPFGRQGGSRSSMSTVSVPSRMNEIAPSGSVRRSPFDRPTTSHGTTHTRSSLGMETRKSVDQDEARPESRQSMSTSSARAKLPWMRSANKVSTSMDENLRPRSATAESLKLDGPLQRPVSREKELPWMNSGQQKVAPDPEKILVDGPVVESPPALEVTVNTADVAALYQDVMESPTKTASEVVVNTADIAEQYNLVLNEPKSLDEKANEPAPAASKASEVVMEKKSSLSGSRPLPMRPSGPRQSAPSMRRIPHEKPVAAPVLTKAETVPERPMPAPPAIVEPAQQRLSHAKKSSISAPLFSAPVLAPPTETLSEVRPPAPENVAMEVKPLPTIYGPPRTDTPPGFSMHPPSLSINAPSIAIRAPSPGPGPEAPMISVSAPPAIDVSGPPAISVARPSIAVSAPPQQQSTRPLPQPTRPLPAPTGSTRPLPRPSSSSSRPLPAPANARPLPSPSARVQPPPNHARPSSDSTSHWSPAPVPAGGRATATCHACSLPIEGRVIALAGLKERWHPACMQCHVCSTALADFEISPEPSFARLARIARIEAREAGDYVAEGEATDGDKRLRFYCHLDWHEAFAPRCQHCKTPIIGEHITALGGKHYHYGHFFCCECGDPFGAGKPHVELEGYAWCTRCMEKRTERRAPKCGLCRKNVVGEVVQALGKEFHAECFRCGDCQDPFVGGEIYLRDDVGVSCRDCMERWAKR